ARVGRADLVARSVVGAGVAVMASELRIALAAHALRSHRALRRGRSRRTGPADVRRRGAIPVVPAARNAGEVLAHFARLALHVERGAGPFRDADAALRVAEAPLRAVRGGVAVQPRLAETGRVAHLRGGAARIGRAPARTGRGIAEKPRGALRVAGTEIGSALLAGSEQEQDQQRPFHHGTVK